MMLWHAALWPAEMVHPPTATNSQRETRPSPTSSNVSGMMASMSFAHARLQPQSTSGGPGLTALRSRRVITGIVFHFHTGERCLEAGLRQLYCVGPVWTMGCVISRCRHRLCDQTLHGLGNVGQVGKPSCTAPA